MKTATRVLCAVFATLSLWPEAFWGAGCGRVSWGVWNCRGDVLFSEHSWCGPEDSSHVKGTLSLCKTIPISITLPSIGKPSVTSICCFSFTFSELVTLRLPDPLCCLLTSKTFLLHIHCCPSLRDCQVAFLHESVILIKAPSFD